MPGWQSVGQDLNKEATQQAVGTAVVAVTTSLGTDGATPPAITGTGVRGWLRAIYERLLATLTIAPASSIIYSNTTPLGSGGTFTTAWFPVGGLAQLNLSCFANVASATDGLLIEWSDDGANVDDSDAYTIPAGNGQTVKFGPGWEFVRFTFTNGAVAQTRFRLRARGLAVQEKSSTHRAADTVNDQQDTDLVTALIKARNGTTGNYEPLNTDSANRLLTGETTMIPRSYTSSTSGPTIAYTPTSGKSIRLAWYHLAASPSNGSPVTAGLRFGAGGTDFVSAPLSQYGGALAHSPKAGRSYYQGAVNEALYLNLSAAQAVTLNIDVEEV
ncbi:MAG TPA: hypothetical protein VFZ38_10620 [Vicinamibacterales bacterium]